LPPATPFYLQPGLISVKFGSKDPVQHLGMSVTMPQERASQEGNLMIRQAVRLWMGILVLGATALLSAVLVLSAPAGAQPTTTPAYGPATAPATVTPTTAPPAPVTTPTIAFTGADLALMFTIGAVAVGAGGALVLVSRRRRSELA
jgi:hypothetical protein